MKNWRHILIASFGRGPDRETFAPIAGWIDDCKWIQNRPQYPEMCIMWCSWYKKNIQWLSDDWTCIQRFERDSSASRSRARSASDMRCEESRQSIGSRFGWGCTKWSIGQRLENINYSHQTKIHSIWYVHIWHYSMRKAHIPSKDLNELFFIQKRHPWRPNKDDVYWHAFACWLMKSTKNPSIPTRQRRVSRYTLPV